MVEKVNAATTPVAAPRAEGAGLAFGLLGVACFSVTLPATRLAVASLDATFVGLGRALVAALLSVLLLGLTRQRLPTRREAAGLLVVAAGVVVGFPLLSALALRTVHASHGAIVVGLLPLATALAGALRVGDRPSWRFWLASVAGSAVVVGFALLSGAGGLEWADLLLLGAVAAGAVGYAEGARLARSLGSWQVICWALVLAAPFIAAPVALSVWRSGLHAPPMAWLSFAYVAVVSQWLGFFAWYRGLSLGGVARVSQVQLLQPFLTLVTAGLLLGEQITPLTVACALLVVGIVAVGRRASIGR
jgi:drug/metabolite transporter (DMT)-like permease